MTALVFYRLQAKTVFAQVDLMILIFQTFWLLGNQMEEHWRGKATLDSNESQCFLKDVQEARAYSSLFEHRGTAIAYSKSDLTHDHLGVQLSRQRQKAFRSLQSRQQPWLPLRARKRRARTFVPRVHILALLDCSQFRLDSVTDTARVDWEILQFKAPVHSSATRKSWVQDIRLLLREGLDPRYRPPTRKA